MFNKLFADLQLFAEGGDGAGDAPAAEDTGDTNTPAAEEDIEGDFAKLTAKGGKYADAYQKQMQKAFNKRFSEFKNSEKELTRLKDFRSAVATRYNVDAEDTDALENAFMSDERFYTKEAFEGEDAKALIERDKSNLKTARLEAQVKAENERRAMEEAMREFHEKLSREEAELKKTYPDLDLDEELKNPKMRKKLRDGDSLEEAYEAVHHKELVKKAAESARAATVNSIEANGHRPAEGSASGAIAATPTVNYKDMSDRDFMKLYDSMFRK